MVKGQFFTISVIVILISLATIVSYLTLPGELSYTSVENIKIQLSKLKEIKNFLSDYYNNINWVYNTSNRIFLQFKESKGNYHDFIYFKNYNETYDYVIKDNKNELISQVDDGIIYIKDKILPYSTNKYYVYSKKTNYQTRPIKNYEVDNINVKAKINLSNGGILSLYSKRSKEKISDKLFEGGYIASNSNVNTVSVENSTGPLFTKYETQTESFSSDNVIIENKYLIFDDFIIDNITAYTKISKNYFWINFTYSCNGHEWDINTNYTTINNFCSSGTGDMIQESYWAQVQSNLENNTIISDPSLWSFGGYNATSIKVLISPSNNKISFLIKSNVASYYVNGIIIFFFNDNNIYKAQNFTIGNFNNEITYESKNKLESSPVDFLKSNLLSKGFTSRMKIYDIDSFTEKYDNQKDWYNEFNEKIILNVNSTYNFTNKIINITYFKDVKNKGVIANSSYKLFEVNSTYGYIYLLANSSNYYEIKFLKVPYTNDTLNISEYNFANMSKINVTNKKENYTLVNIFNYRVPITIYSNKDINDVIVEGNIKINNVVKPSTIVLVDDKWNIYQSAINFQTFENSKYDLWLTGNATYYTFNPNENNVSICLQKYNKLSNGMLNINITTPNKTKLNYSFIGDSNINTLSTYCINFSRKESGFFKVNVESKNNAAFKITSTCPKLILNNKKIKITSTSSPTLGKIKFNTKDKDIKINISSSQTYNISLIYNDEILNYTYDNNDNSLTYKFSTENERELVINITRNDGTVELNLPNNVSFTNDNYFINLTKPKVSFISYVNLTKGYNKFYLYFTNKNYFKNNYYVLTNGSKVKNKIISWDLKNQNLTWNNYGDNWFKSTSIWLTKYENNINDTLNNYKILEINPIETVVKFNFTNLNITYYFSILPNNFKILIKTNNSQIGNLTFGPYFNVSGGNNKKYFFNNTQNKYDIENKNISIDKSQNYIFGINDDYGGFAFITKNNNIQNGDSIQFKTNSLFIKNTLADTNYTLFFFKNDELNLIDDYYDFKYFVNSNKIKYYIQLNSQTTTLKGYLII